MDTPDALAAAATGMRAQATVLDVIAQNLANTATAGFRPRVAAYASFDDELRATTGLSSTQGPLRHTGVATDLALNGSGYFAVATRDGVRYTRDGRMMVDPQGYLTDERGDRLLGALGPVRFPPGASVDENGRIAIAGTVTDRLRVVTFDPPCDNVDSNLFTPPHGCIPTRSQAQVRAGYLEDSGVDALTQMSALIAAQRAYEANEKSASRSDESLRRLVTDVPALRS
jgi:flagellar basal-body rod protein FlgF